VTVVWPTYNLLQALHFNLDTTISVFVLSFFLRSKKITQCSVIKKGCKD
jgi:hypothetical protein